MSNDLMDLDNLPEAYKDLLAQLGNDNNLAGGMFGISRRVSIRGGRFRKIVNGEEVQVFDRATLDIVIVNAAQISRMFYEKGFVEGEISEPTCWSPDGKIPAVEVPEKNRQCEDCGHCPQNVKGSGQNDTRACRYQQRIAVLLAGDNGAGIMTKEIYGMILPATSIFGGGGQEMSMQGYARYLAAHKTPSKAIVTEMRFDTESSTPKLYFKPVRPLNDKELAIVVEMQTHQETVDAITQHVYISDGIDEETPALPAAFNTPIGTPVPAKKEPPSVDKKKATPNLSAAEKKKAKLLMELKALEEAEATPVKPVLVETPEQKAAREKAEKKAALQKQLEAMDEDDAPPVTAKDKTPAKAPAESGDLASILDKWDD